MTAREYQIAKLRIDGFKLKEIADFLNTNHKTVSAHMYNLYSELEVHNVAQLTKKIRTYLNNGFKPEDII